MINYYCHLEFCFCLTNQHQKSDPKLVSDDCFEKSHAIMKMWKDVIANFDKQSKRMEKQNGTGESKAGKKGEFKHAAHKLVTAGGGNKSALSCAGSTDNSGAAQMKNLTDFLNGCEDAIHDECNATNFHLVNQTKLMACKEVADAFKTGAEECLGKTVGAKKTRTADACTCWTSDSLQATAEAAKECKFSDEAKAFAAALKSCRNKFAECRKYEDDVAESISVCRSNADDLKKEVGLVFIIDIFITTFPPQVAALSQNADKVKEAQAVVKALAASRRMKRQTTAASCSEVNSVAITLTAMVFEFPGAPEILVLSAAIISFPSSSVVCTEDEKAALAAVDEAFDDAVGHLDSALEAAHSQLLTLTGATLSPAEIAEVAAATTSTAGPTETPAAGETTAPGGSPAPGETTAPAPADTYAPPPAETSSPPPPPAETTGPSSPPPSETSGPPETTGPSDTTPGMTGPTDTTPGTMTGPTDTTPGSTISTPVTMTGSTDTTTGPTDTTSGPTDTTTGPTDTTSGSTDTTSGTTDTTTGPSTTTEETTTTA